MAIYVYSSNATSGTFLDGTAALPSLSFLADPDTGIYRSADNRLDLTTGGTQRWSITSAGILQSNGSQTIQTSAGTLTLNPTENVTVTNALTVGSQLIVSGTGPHAIGGATVPNANLYLQGTFTKTGAANNVQGLSCALTLVPAVGDNVFGTVFGGTITRAGSGTHSDVAAVRINPLTTGTGTAAITNNSSLVITDAPATGTNKYALWVNLGESRFDADIGDTTNVVPNIYATTHYGTTYKSITGNLTIATGGGSGDILFSPNGTGKIRFFGSAGGAQQTSGANLTNSVTAGGVNDTIANYTDLTTYSNDAAAIRNDIYQLARQLKQCNDALRVYGLLT